MAKTAAPQPVTAPPVHDLPAKVAKAVDTLRIAFKGFVEDFSALTLSREELAPRFMTTFGQWQAATGGTFVSFVRLLVPAIPMDREGYKAHPAYAAADNLRRLAQQGDRAEETPVQRAQRIASAPINPRIALARTLASFLPLIQPEALDALWSAVGENLHWTEGQIESMKALVESEPPLMRVTPPRGVHVEHALRVTAAPDTRDATLAQTA